MMPSNHKGFIVLEKAFNIVIKWDELGHVWIHNLRLKEILQISAVTKVVRSVSLICSILDFAPIVVQMSLNSRIIFNSDSRDTPLYTIMSIDKPELRPVIAISLSS